MRSVAVGSACEAYESSTAPSASASRDASAGPFNHARTTSDRAPATDSPNTCQSVGSLSCASVARTASSAASSTMWRSDCSASTRSSPGADDFLTRPSRNRRAVPQGANARPRRISCRRPAASVVFFFCSSSKSSWRCFATESTEEAVLPPSARARGLPVAARARSEIDAIHRADVPMPTVYRSAPAPAAPPGRAVACP